MYKDKAAKDLHSFILNKFEKIKSSFCSYNFLRNFVDYISNYKNAFTMAEAVLVMTILGIIATVMITTMKPAKFKDQGYEVLAKSVYADIDNAITQILADKTPYNNFETIYKSGSSEETFSMKNAYQGSLDEFAKLLKDYLATARGEVPDVCKTAYYNSPLLLKNGACIAMQRITSKVDTLIPGESSTTPLYLEYGLIFVDTNGNDEPNTLGKDQFNIPLSKNGIYDGDGSDDDYNIRALAGEAYNQCMSPCGNSVMNSCMASKQPFHSQAEQDAAYSECMVTMCRCFKACCTNEALGYGICNGNVGSAVPSCIPYTSQL